jgi:transcriptional regulator with XRE-family HTH domain
MAATVAPPSHADGSRSLLEDGCLRKSVDEEGENVQPHLGLARKLDERIGDCAGHIEEPPVLGFIRSARMATGVTIRQLADRLGVTAQAVHRMEASERAGRISVNRLREAADALDCDLVLELIPRSSFRGLALHRYEAQHQSKAHLPMGEVPSADTVEGELDEAIYSWL